jgi:DNA-binding NarL/FixJ family response regulator
MFRQGLARLLDSHGGIEVVAWVPNDDEVPELARELRPDVVVMEVRVGLEEAGASLYAILAISPPPKVIIVTMIEDPAMMRAFLRLGASGYVPKSASTADLVDAIRTTASAPEDGNAGAGGLGGASWVPLTAEDLTAEDIGENGANGRD